jgi:hypothetical protein
MLQRLFDDQREAFQAQVLLMFRRIDGIHGICSFSSMKELTTRLEKRSDFCPSGTICG